MTGPDETYAVVFEYGTKKILREEYLPKDQADDLFQSSSRAEDLATVSVTCERNGGASKQ
jgi:hypothetical protein